MYKRQKTIHRFSQAKIYVKIIKKSTKISNKKKMEQNAQK